jgi:hypothetical protein
MFVKRHSVQLKSVQKYWQIHQPLTLITLLSYSSWLQEIILDVLGNQVAHCATYHNLQAICILIPCE